MGRRVATPRRVRGQSRRSSCARADQCGSSIACSPTHRDRRLYPGTSRSRSRPPGGRGDLLPGRAQRTSPGEGGRSEEHTSELQSHHDLVCRLLLEKKKNNTYDQYIQKKKNQLKK